MSVSRKEFLTRGLAAFGAELLQSVRGEAAPAGSIPGGEEFGPLLVDNRRCLAQRGGCFACMDRCPHGAIGISLGVGISIDPEKCDGCGICIDYCPVEPKVIAMGQVGTAMNGPQ
jgi:Pyruvate/2-oxoacid:ferredoxin oxidoreductase delta subunit